MGTDKKAEPLNSGSLHPENMGELLLKNAALTSSAKGIDNDLRNIITMKIEYSKAILDKVVTMLDVATKCPDKKITRELLSEGGIVMGMLSNTLSEVFITNIALNNMLTSTVLKEMSLLEEQKNFIMEDIEQIMSVEKTRLVS